MTPSFAAAVRAALLLACAWTFAASAAEDAAEAEFFLPPGAFEGFRKDGEALVPLAQVHALDAGGVLFEAERPDEVLWAPGGQAGEDSDGTRYAAGFKMLRYYVQSAKPAKVALWARLKYAPENVRLHVNEGQWTNASDLTAAGKDPKAKDAYKEFAGAWRWSKLAVFEVPAGVSPLQLVAPWPGYNHSPLLPWPQDLLLDKLALLAGDANPEQAPPAERRAAPAACWVRSQALNLEAARGFGTPALKGSGAAVLETSADDGKTWSPAGAAAPGGRLLVRARFEPGAAARVEGFAVRARVDAAKYLRLRSPVLELGFDIAGHGVHRLTDLAAGRALLHPETARPLFTLELKERGKPFPDPRHILEPKDGVLKEAKLKDGGRAAELTYLFLDGALRATASLDLGKDREILWKLELKNDSAYDILSYVFPRLGGIQVGGSGRDDTFLNTNFYGPWLAVTETFGEFRPEDRPFPGWGRLAFCDLSDAKAGLALATREPREGETSYVARPTLPRWGETISLDAVKNHCVPAGEKKSWTYALYAHEGGWQAAADWHGAWFRKEFGAAEFPEWARDSHGWLNENTALKDAYFKWPMLWDAFENARRLGLNHVQVWGQFGCNSCAAFWWPSPKFGTAEEFAAQNRRIKAAGGHIGYYLMYHIYNRYNNLDTETYEGYLPRGDYPSGVPLLTVEQLKRGAMVGDPSGKAAGVWPENDKELDEFRANLKRLLDAKESTTWANSKDGTFPKHSMVTLNPLDDVWQRFIEKWTVDLYVRQWACDTPYEDVMGCSSVGRSFDASRGDHGHIRNGEWDMAKRLAESGRKASPDFALLAEGSGELVSRWAMGMTSNRHYGWRDLRAHRLAHPDHILFLGGSNGGYHEMLHNCELAYLCGARFDLIMAGDVFAIRKLVRFRVALNRWAARAAYRDTLGLELDDSRVLATRHERLAGGARGVLVTAVNREGVKDAPLGVAVAVFEGKPFGAFWLDEDGGARRIEPAVTGGLLRTAVPPAGLSALLLVAEAPKDEDLLGGVVLARKPNACEARAWLCNLAPRARDIELRLDGPAGNGETRRVRLEPFGVFNAAFALPLGPGDGYVRLHAEGRELAVSYLYPLLADPSYEAKGTEAPDAPDGRRVLHFGPRKGWQGHGAALELAPGGKYLIQAKGRRTGTKGAIHGLVIMERPNGKKEYAGIHFPKDQQDFAAWVDLRAEFKAPGDLTGASLYLYNSDSEETVDYDAVRVEMLE